MRLAIDTATRHVVVALGSDHGLATCVVREVLPGRGTPLLTLIDQALGDAGVTMAQVRAIGVGTGPGSFTGLRAGLATAKTLCWLRRLPLVALPTDQTIRRAAALADARSRDPVVVVLPAGARDHYVALPDGEALLVPPSVALATILDGRPAAALDLVPGDTSQALARDALAHGHPDPMGLGVAALGRVPEALLQLMHERLAAGSTEDPATLVPRYVALPRGVAAPPTDSDTSVTGATGRDGTWSATQP